MTWRLPWLLLALWGASGCGGTMTEGGILPELESGESLSDPFSPGDAENLGADALVTQASVYLEHGQIARADRLNQRALIRRPDHLGGLVVDARVATARGEFDRAWTRFDHTFALYPSTAALGPLLPEVVPVTVALSEELREDGRPVEALRLMDRLRGHVAHHMGRFTSSLRTLVVNEIHQVALLLIRVGLQSHAEEALESSLAFGARTLSGDGALARAQIDALESHEGEEPLHHWARQSPETRWIRVARWHESRHEHGESRRAYQAATEVDSDPIESWSGLARSCLSQRDVSCAQEAFQRAASFATTADLQLELTLSGARALEDQAGSSHALPLYQASVSLAPRNWEVVSEAITALGRNRRAPEVQKIVFDYVRGADRPDDALDRGLRTLRDLRLGVAAAEVLRRLGGLSTPPLSLPLALASALPDQGTHDGERAELLQRYTQGWPDEVHAHLESARLWLKLRRFDRAMGHAMEAQALDPGHPRAMLLEAQAWEGQRDQRRAKRARDRVRACARAELRCAVALSEVERGSVGPAAALNHLEPWLHADGVELSADFHRARYLAAMDSVRRFPHVVEPALRAWRRFMPEEDRRTTLEDALVRIGGEPKLRHLRIELLRELERWAYLEDRSRRSLIRELQSAGRITESIAVWERIVQDAGDPSAARLEAGADLQRLGFDEQAIRFFNGVDVSRITEERTHQSLAELFTGRGQRERATVHHERLIASRSTPTNPARLRKYVRELLAHRDGERAREVNAMLLEVAPRDREALMSDVRIAILLGDAEARRGAVEALMKTTSQHARSNIWQKVGEALVAEGLLAPGLDAYIQALATARRQDERSKLIKTLTGLCPSLGEPSRILELEALTSAGKNPGQEVRVIVGALEDHGLLEEAAGVLQRALEKKGIQRRSLLLAAFENAAWRDAFEEADGWLRELLEVETLQASSWVSAAGTWSGVGESPRALALIDEASRRFPGDWDVARTKARLLLESGDRAGAEEVYVGSLAAAKPDQGILKQVAQAARKDRMTDWLHTLLARATATLETRQEPLLERARTALEIGNTKLARALLSRYLGVDRRGHLEVAKLAREEKMDDLALRHYTWAVTEPLSGADSFPLNDYADLLVEQGQADERQRRFLEILRHAKDPSRVMIDAARVLLERGGREAALEWLDLAEDLAPKHEIELLRGHVYLELGHVQRATDVFERVLRGRSMAKSSRSSVRFQRKAKVLAGELSQMAQAFESRGEFTAGAEWIGRLRASPLGRAGQLTMFAGHEALLWIRSGQIERGLQVMDGIQFTKDSQGGEPRLWLRLAEALCDRGLRADAIRLLSRVVKRVSHADLHFARLRYLVREGRGNAAWRAARVLMGRFKADSAAQVIEIALDGGLPSLARRVTGYAQLTSPAPRMKALNHRLRMRGVAEHQGSRGPGGASAADLRSASSLSARRRDFRFACETSLAALRLEPTHPETQRRSLRLAAHVGDERAFEEILDVISRASRSRHRGLRQGAQILRASGMAERAMELQQRARRMAPGDPGLAMETLLTALDAGKLGVAVSLGDEVLQRWGDQDDLRLELAETWLRYGETARAESAASLGRARRGPRAWRAAKIRAAIHHAQGDVERAVLSLSAASSTAFNPLLAVAEAFDQLEAWGGSIQTLSQLLDAVDSRFADAPILRLLRIRLAWRTGTPSESSEALVGLLRDAVLTPSDVAEALYHAARAAEEAAIDRLQSELVKHIGRLEARRVSGLRILLALDREAAGLGPPLTPAERRSLALRAVSAMEDGLGQAFLPEAGYVSSVGQAYDLADRPGAALWLYENHALQVPWDSTARNNWAYALAEAERDLPLALAVIRRAMEERDEPLASFLDTEAWVLHKLGRHDEALEAMERAILYATDSRYQTPEGRVEMMYHRGVILEASGQVAAAQRVFRGCAARGPDLSYGARCRRALRVP